MPPKVSKKTEQKKKDRVIEDKTFGLKNKNKSKSVQKYIQSVTTNVQNSGGKVARAEEKKRLDRQAARIAKKQQEDELNALFGAALAVNVKKKSIKMAGQSAEPKEDTDVEVKEEQKLTAQEQLEREQKARAEAKATAAPVFEQETFFVAEETKTIENIIEEKRAELAAKGLVGTPVTEESFAAWKEGRRLRRLEENAKRVEEEQKKKKGGKGLSILSGKALFEYDPTLFVDDDEAMDRSDEVQYPRDMDAEIEDDDNNNNNGNDSERKESSNGNNDVRIQEGLFTEDENLDDIPDDDDDDEGEDDDTTNNSKGAEEMRVNRTEEEDK